MDVQNQRFKVQTKAACLSQPVSWSMAAMLHNFIVIIVVVCTLPRAIPLTMITRRKSIHEFPFLFYMSTGLSLAFGPPELRYQVTDVLI